MTATVDTPSLDEAYEQHAKLISYLVGRFCRRFPLANYEDCLSEANWCLVRNHDKFDPSRGKSYATFLSWNVQKELLSLQRTACHKLDRLCKYRDTMRPVMESNECVSRNNIDQDEQIRILRGRLSTDAAFVIDLVLFESATLASLTRAVKTYAAYKRTLRMYLAEYRDWPEGRIRRVFSEIKQVMKEMENDA